MKKYLALGDSYTIGEQLELSGNFPHQLYRLLNAEREIWNKPQIIATTGWTTDELALAIAKQKPPCEFDLVTLLIGVNNQYRGRLTSEYYWQFYGLLCQAILFAKANPANVVVLSIPDWGLTPFNTERDKSVTSKEIDEFNQINFEISKHFGTKYIDVTSSTRKHSTDENYLSTDKLHYSEKEYAIWAREIFSIITT